MSDRRDFYYWRIVASGISFTLFGFGGLILGYILLPTIACFSRSRERGTKRCRYIIHLSFRAFIWFMRSTGVLTWSVEDAAALKQEGQLIIANHPTLIDIVFLISMIPNATCIVKSALYTNIFTRGPVRFAGYVPNNSPHQLIEDCASELQAGASLVVFPEGSRSVGSIPRPFKRGAAYLWLRARCKIALVTILATPPTLAKNDKWYEVPPVRSHFRLIVNEGSTHCTPCNGEKASIGARLLTRQWQDHFTKEMKQ